MVVLEALREHGGGLEQDAKRTTRRRRGPGPGICAARGGEGGFSGNMKRTQTAEEREREAKVRRPSRGLGFLLRWELEAGNRKGLLCW